MWLLRILRRAVLVLAVLGVLLTILAVATPQGRAAAKTGGFVFQVLPAIPVKPLEWFTAAPIKEEVFFPQSQGEGVADLYRPRGTGKRANCLFSQKLVSEACARRLLVVNSNNDSPTQIDFAK